MKAKEQIKRRIIRPGWIVFAISVVLLLIMGFIYRKQKEKNIHNEKALKSEINRQEKNNENMELKLKELNSKIDELESKKTDLEIEKARLTEELEQINTSLCPDGVRNRYKVINEIALSPDGNFLAAVYGTLKVKLWNVETGKVVHTFDNEGYEINYVQFSPDGRLLAASGGCPPYLDTSPCSARQLRFWSVKTGRLTKGFDTTPPEGKAAGTDWGFFAFSPDGKYVATAESEMGEIVLRDSGTKEIIKTSPVKANVFSFSADGRYIVAPDRQRYRIIIWDAKTSKIYKEIDASGLWGVDGVVGFWSVSYGPDGKFIYLGKYEYVYSGYINPQIIVFSVSDGKIIRKIPGYNTFSTSDEGTLAAVNYSDSNPRVRAIDILDPESGEILRSFKTCDLGLRNFSLSADGKMLTAPGYGGSNTINIWEASTGKIIRILDK